MSVQLSELTYSRFLPVDALTYTESTLPLYREAAGSNEFFVGLVDDIAQRHKVIIQYINRNSASDHTPVAQKWDQARTDAVFSLNSHFDSLIRRVLSVPDKTEAAARLLTIMKIKCPEFYNLNNDRQTVSIDALKEEIEKEENGKLVTLTGADELFADLFNYNEQYKVAINNRIEESRSSPTVRSRSNAMMKKVSLMHNNLGELMENKPGVYDEIAQKINSFIVETMAGIRARLTRGQNKENAPVNDLQTVS